MDRTRGWGLAALAALLAALPIVFGDLGVRRGAPAARGARVISVEDAAALAALPAEASRRSREGATLGGAGLSASEPVTAATSVEGDLAGSVVDARGRPIADARVHLAIAGSDSIRGALAVRTQPRAEEEWPALYRTTTSDRSGSFVFDAVPTEDGGDLSVVAEAFPLYTQYHAVDLNAPHQVVRFPAPMAGDCEWVVELVDTAGEPLQADAADVRFLGHTVRGVVQLAEAQTPRLERGRVVVGALQPGRWEIRVDVAGTFGGSTACRLEGQGARATSRLVLERHPGAITASSVEPSALDGLPWIDPSSGLARWVPAARRGLADEGADRTFVTTLRTGFGPATGAELVLELRASSGMASDDTVALEFVSDGSFRWQARIAEYTHGWSTGSRATLRLDLARLPVGGALGVETLSLLPDLEDGFLDVVVEDDTVVEAVSLRVAR